MNNQLLCFGLLDIVISVIIGIKSLLESTSSFNFGITYIAEIILMIIFVVLQHKNIFNVMVRDCYIITSYMICQILQIEFIEQHQSSEYVLFLTIKLFVLITAIQRFSYKIVLSIIILTYLFVRFQFYSNYFSYLSIGYLPTLFINKNLKEDIYCMMIEFFRNTLENSILIIDAKTKEHLFHSYQLEQEFDFNINSFKSFFACLCKFQDSSQKCILDIFDEQKQSLTKITNIVEFCKLNETSCEEYQYFENSKSKKATTYLHDEINEEKQDFVNIESPKCQIEGLKQVSNQYIDDTPYNLKSKFSQFKDSHYKLQGITELRQKRISIKIQHCIWKKKEAFMIQIKDLENKKMIQILNDELDESRKQNDNKDQILATVFHDFKTPINGICAIVESMEEKSDLSSQSKYYLRIIRKNVYLMLYMIYDILDFARIQKNQLRLSLTNFYLNEIINEVVELVAIQADQKGVIIQTHYDIPSYQIYSDPNRIKQILMNFISNSLKFTESGSITISVESLSTDRSQHIVRTQSSKNVFNQQQNQNTSVGQLRKQLSGKSMKLNQNTGRLIYTITITDTGCGISETIKPQLFNMYATFSSREQPNQCGTGIGLMVCKKLIKLLGPSEKIELWSEQNKGTKMSFQIYSRLPDDPKRSPNYINVYKQESSSKNFNIDSPSFNEDQFAQQKIVRSSILRVFTRPVEKNDTEADQDNYPDMEDEEQEKLQNINFLQNQKSPTVSRIKIKDQTLEDSQDIMDPRIRLAKILQNQKFTILIVDDQPFNVLALKLLLQDISTNITFLEAYNGQQAINKLQAFQKSKNIKYVFMDLFMPILNGWQATQVIREMIRKQQLQEVKIIAISGYDDENDQERCGDIGFDAFVTKPVKLEIIAEVFAQLENS